MLDRWPKINLVVMSKQIICHETLADSLPCRGPRDHWPMFQCSILCNCSYNWISSVCGPGRRWAATSHQPPAPSTQHPAIHQRNIKKKTVNSFCSYKFIMTSRLPANKKVLILFLCNYIQHSRAVCLREMLYVTSYITSWSILHESAM